MTIRVSPSLQSIIDAETTQYNQVRALEAALTATRRVKAKRVTDATLAQDSVWTTGTLFRDAALTGAFTYLGAEITSYGVTSDMTTAAAADLTTGKSVLRIEGSTHWLEGTVGLAGSGADFILSAAPTTTNSLAIGAGMRINANPTLPVGTPDVNPPAVTIAASTTSITTPTMVTITANATDDVGVARVEFYRNAVLVLNKTTAPFTYADSLTFAQNGTNSYYAIAFDSTAKNTTSNMVSVAVNIAAPAETGPVTDVGAELTTITLQSTSAVAQTNVPVTFGQAFMIGALPTASAAVELRAPDATIIVCQLDVKATHKDGSIRHAIISAKIPNMAASSSTTYSILRKAAPLAGVAPVPANFTGLTASFELVDSGTALSGPEGFTAYTADAAARLAGGTYETWLSGPIVSEWIVRVPLVANVGGAEHPDLHARFSIRAYAGETKAKIDCVLENTWVKPKTVASGNTPWVEGTSNTPRIYSYVLKVSGVEVDRRSTKGFHRTRLTFQTSGVYDNSSTGIPNNSTVYTAAVAFDGVVKNLSVVGSGVQTYGQLISALRTQIGSAGTCAGDDGMLGLRFTSSTVGVGSTAVITDYGTLFPAQIGTGLSSATTYTASITIDGSIVKPISMLGSKGMSFAQLCAELNLQMGGAATCEPQLAAPGIKFKSTSSGLESGVVVSDGTLFAITKLKFMVPYRAIRGDEYLHYPRTLWKKTYWWGAAPAVHIIHNKVYLMATKAVPNYQPELVGDLATIANNLAIINAADIGTNGISKAVMGDVGYAPGIGILPEWAAMWLVSQNADAKATMLKMGDLQGSWPAHSREFDTNQPIDFQKWPYATYSPNSGDSVNPITNLREMVPAIVIPSQIPSNKNAPDVAHHPDFCFLPYLVTGDHFYMEGLLFYNRYTALSQNSNATFRQGKKNLWAINQTRGVGWAIRTAAHATYITPDTHSLRPDLAYTMEQNIIWINTNWVDPASLKHSIFGHIGGLIYSRAGLSNNALAPWQEDFVTMSVGRAVECGFPEFMAFLNYKAKFVAGRMTSGAAYCFQLATAYTIRFRESSATAQYLTWNEVYLNTFSATLTAPACGTQAMADALTAADGRTILINGMTGYTELISGYPANLQPAIAYCATFNCTDGDNAWLVYDNRAQKQNYNLGPQFGIVPRP